MLCRTCGCPLPASDRLLQIYGMLLEQYGPQYWWPAETPFEVCIGAILTQNTSWSNVEKAIASLKAADLLTVSAIAGLEPSVLAALIRPAGYFNVKAVRLQQFVRFLQTQHQGCLEHLFAGPWQETRAELLAVKGIGPETADSILLYAGHKPSFVVDTYTRRIFSRLGLVTPESGYHVVRDFFMHNLPQDCALFNEYHALLVAHAKQACRTQPRCAACCLAPACTRQNQIVDVFCNKHLT